MQRFSSSTQRRAQAHPQVHASCAFIKRNAGTVKLYGSVLVGAALLAGCGNIANVRSFSTAYSEPVSGPMAKIRIISNGMVRAVPNSQCIDWRLPGAGVMVVNRAGFAKVTQQDLGMQKTERTRLSLQRPGVASSELAIQAGKPIVLHFMGMGTTTMRGSGSTFTTTRVACNKGYSFVPEAGKEYEANFIENGSICSIQMGDLAAKHAVNAIDLPQLAEAGLCNVRDIL